MKAHVGRCASASRIEIKLRAAHSIPRESIRRQLLSEVDLVKVGLAWGGLAERSFRPEDERGGQLFHIGDLVAEWRRSIELLARDELNIVLPSRSHNADVQGQVLTLRERRGAEPGGKENGKDSS
jgi:hypothetical protein